MRKIIITILCLCSIVGYAQFPYGTTGLLHMPTADMQRDKTFLSGASFLPVGTTPSHWSYDTYNYYINITIFPWLEIGYTCTLHKGENNGYWPEQTWGKFTNQDRNFAIRLRAWKEGWWKPWTPQVVVGVNDATSTFSALENDYSADGVGGEGNGYWNRYFIAATKHIDFPNYGNLGVHAAYVYNKRLDYPLNGPAFGANFKLGLPETTTLNKIANGLDLRAEYDSRTVNIGAEYGFWKDYISGVVEWNACKRVAGGVVFRVHLK